VVRYGLDHSALPPEATHGGGFLSRLLSEAADEPENLPLVVGVDALDEAEDAGLASGANRLFLPPSLPAGVYFVVSTREHVPAAGHLPARRRPAEPRGRSQLHRNQIDAKQEVMKPRIEQWEVPQDEFVDVLTAKSAGNFMYLVHVLRDIAAGVLTTEDVDDIQKLPHGLRDYYQRHWNAMRSADQEQFRRYQRPVVCLLATVREPVAVPQLLEWTSQFWQRQGWDPAALDPIAVADVLKAWREFLDEDRVDRQVGYRVYHASFQDFLADEVGLTDYHQTIGETALAKIPGFADGD
jgi:hypothetical protein